MKIPGRRSRDVTHTLTAPASAAPRDADIAFEDLYRSSRDDLFAYVCGMLRDRSAAEDITAAAFERAYRKRSRFDPNRGDARGWLFGIARNAALDELRRRSRRADLTDEPIDAGAQPLASIAEDRESRIALREALKRVSTRDRELISMKFFAGLSNLEIAETLGTSETNAGTRLHRAVSKLREVFDESA